MDAVGVGFGAIPARSQCPPEDVDLFDDRALSEAGQFDEDDRVPRQDQGVTTVSADVVRDDLSGGGMAEQLADVGQAREGSEARQGADPVEQQVERGRQCASVKRNRSCRVRRDRRGGLVEQFAQGDVLRGEIGMPRRQVREVAAGVQSLAQQHTPPGLQQTQSPGGPLGPGQARIRQGESRGIGGEPGHAAQRVLLVAALEMTCGQLWQKPHRGFQQVGATPRVPHSGQRGSDPAGLNAYRRPGRSHVRRLRVRLDRVVQVGVPG
ncbi:hypothetical protein ACFQ9X_33625 [Catenulispora yoronensis]